MPREKRTSNPEVDKEIGDSTALKPVLTDFRQTHPNLRYRTFLGDAAFDSYDNYRFLLNEYRFKKAVTPLNPRGGLPTAGIGFNENGTPLYDCSVTAAAPSTDIFTLSSVAVGELAGYAPGSIAPSATGSAVGMVTETGVARNPATPLPNAPK